MFFIIFSVNKNKLFASWDSPNFLTSQPHKSVEIQRKIGDHTMHFINLSALILIAYNKDAEGFKQYLASMGITAFTTSILKFSVARYRPNFSNQDSFPSGHSSFAFSGASFIYDRYGPKFGIPFYVLATYVAYSRVVAKRHHITDVLTGAAISIAMTKLFVTPYNFKIGKTNVQVIGTPTIGNQYFGITLTARF